LVRILAMPELIAIFFLLICSVSAQTDTLETSLSIPRFSNTADPDNISSCYEYNGTPLLRMGNLLSMRYIDAGGFVEVRNEPRFNQSVLPNHNWRGFGFIYVKIPVFLKNSGSLYASAGIEHECAHPTMGIMEPAQQAVELIYDGTYRRYILNSVCAAIVHRQTFARWSLAGSIEYQFYIQSKNTPELPNPDLSMSHGFSAGATSSLNVFKRFVWISGLFGRVIAQGIDSRTGPVYFDRGKEQVQIISDYPVINNTTTLSVKSGLYIDGILKGRKPGLYFSFLYGHIHGFVDSRDTRTRFSAGLELLR
jgi:hypothetical protein